MGNLKSLKLMRVAFTVFFCLFAYALSAQTINVKGKVKDSGGESIIGANIHVLGTTSGTTTDVNGDFSLQCDANAKLEITYLGMEKQVVSVGGKRSLNVVLKEGKHELGEVVVTALGIKRSAKALGYAATSVDTKEIENANTISPVTALQGKVAGVEIAQSDGGMFGSTKIEIRGASTLSSNNQPIFVVDGVILDNATSNSGDADWNANINDYGNQLKNLNPDDFASVTVLKGAAATALYGSRGLNGAVVITTKSGKGGNKNLGISFSQTVGIDYVYRTPDLQNQYLEGIFPGSVQYGDDYTQTGNRWSDNMTAYARNTENKYSMIQQQAGVSWGPSIDWAAGKEFEQYDKTYGPEKIYKNNYKDAFDTGFTSNTNLSLSGGNDRTTFYTSLSYRYNHGITPRNTFQRLSFLGKASQKIGKAVKVDFGINFVQSKPKNALPNLGESFANGTFPRDYDTKKYKHLYAGTHGGLAQTKYGDEYGSVPGRDLWWSIFEDNDEHTEWTIRPTLDITADLTSWLSLKAGVNFNYYLVDAETKVRDADYANQGTGGSYSLSHSSTYQENIYGSLNANKQLNDDWEIHGFLREEYFNQHAQYNAEWTNGGLIVPNQYFISNSKQQAGQAGYKFDTKRIVSTIFAVGTSWKNQVFLDVTGRNDWSSALVYTDGTGNFSYFYPSVSGSWILSDTFRKSLPDWITYMKLRASWAQVGNDTDPYYINSGYNVTNYTKDGQKVYGLSIPDQIKSTDLKPERKNSWEFGLDWRFLNNRIGIDFTYYKENTKNQIMSISVPYYSGVKSELVNAGNIQNQGIELALNTTPYKSKDWQWDLNFTYTRNRNKIISLHPDVANYIVLDGDPAYGNYRIGSVAKVGSFYGELMSDSWAKYDEKTGKKLVGYANGYHTIYYKRGGEVRDVGSMLPDFLGSLNTTVRWKSLSLYALLDCRFGGYVASYNTRYATAYGYSKASEKYRNGMTWTSNYADCKGKTFTDGFIPDVIFDAGTKVTQPDGSSVDVSGMTYQEAYDKGYVEPAHMQTTAYFANNWGNGVINDDWFKKLNYIALREITITYAFPQSVYRYIGAKGLSLSLTGRNLCYLYNTAPGHENPESIRGTSASAFRMRSFSPYTASYLFTIRANF